MADDKWTRPDAPPPPLFTGQKEADFVKQINDEVIERVVGQQVLYFPVSREHSNYHPLYGEAIEKTYLPPIRVYSRVSWKGTKTEFTKYGIDRRPQIVIDLLNIKTCMSELATLFDMANLIMKLQNLVNQNCSLTRPTKVLR